MKEESKKRKLLTRLAILIGLSLILICLEYAIYTTQSKKNLMGQLDVSFTTHLVESPGDFQEKVHVLIISPGGKPDLFHGDKMISDRLHQSLHTEDVYLLSTPLLVPHQSEVDLGIKSQEEETFIQGFVIDRETWVFIDGTIGQEEVAISFDKIGLL